MNLIEQITLKKDTYDALTAKAAFYDAYVKGKIAFADKKQQDIIQLWTKENAFVEIEEYYKTLHETYKRRLDAKRTFKFWKWKIKLTRSA